MTLTTTSTKSVAVSNGADVNWPFNFIIPALEDLTLTVINTASGDETIIAPANYTVTGLGDPLGGVVTYPTSGSPLAVGYTIVVERFVDEVQETDLINQGGTYPEDIEEALDYLTMQVQQLQDQVNRSIVFSVADTVAPTLPLAAARANKQLGFASNGDPIAIAGIDPSVTVSAAMIPVVTAPTTAQALTELGLPGALLDLLIPAGTVWPYSLTTAPTGFALAYGQPCTGIWPVYRAALIAAGSPYGTNGVDPLLPDLRSAVPAGKSNMGGIDNGLLTGGTVLGALLGAQTRVLVTSNLPPFTPSGNIANADHFHQIPSLTAGGTFGGSGSGTPWLYNVSTATNTGGVASGGTSVFTGNAQGGTSAAFSIVQPSLVLNYIVKVH